MDEVGHFREEESPYLDLSRAHFALRQSYSAGS